MLSEAAHRRRRVWLHYHSRQGEESERAVDVYGVVCYEGIWYAVGHDHLRADLRTFRIDRVREAHLRDEGFTRPAGFDAVAHVERAIATMPGALVVDVLLETTMEEARRLVPAAAAALEETPCGVLAHGQVRDAQDLDTLAHMLAGLGCPLVICRPEELRDALRRLAAHATHLAERCQGDVMAL